MKPALPAVVYRRPNCWKVMPRNTAGPANRPETINFFSLITKSDVFYFYYSNKRVEELGRMLQGQT